MCLPAPASEENVMDEQTRTELEAAKKAAFETAFRENVGPRD